MGWFNHQPEEMLHLPEEEAEKEAKVAAELLQKAAKASEAAGWGLG